MMDMYDYLMIWCLLAMIENRDQDVGGYAAKIKFIEI